MDSDTGLVDLTLKCPSAGVFHYRAGEYLAWLENYLMLLRKTLLLLGRRSLCDLRNHPLIIGGSVAHWLEARGISTRKYAQRCQAKERGQCHQEL